MKGLNGLHAVYSLKWINEYTFHSYKHIYIYIYTLLYLDGLGDEVAW